MQKSTESHLNEEIFFKKSGYSYIQLLDQALLDNESLLPLLEQSDLCVFINNGYEFDPDHIHIIPTMLEKYNLKTHCLDITDQGILSLPVALHVIKKYFENNNTKSTLLIALEQRALTLQKNPQTILPDFNGVAFLSLTQSCCKKSLQLISAKTAPLKKINDIVFHWTNKKTIFYFLSSQKNIAPPHFLLRTDFSVIPIAQGLLPLFQFLEKLQKNFVTQRTYQRCVILVEDAGEWGVIVLN